MPLIKSAKKRVKTAAKAGARNRRTKRSLKSALKVFASSVSSGDKKKTAGAHAKAQSALDKAGKKKIMHKNKVARKKRQLAASAKKAGVKTAGTAKKTPVKKPTDKKTIPKKTVAKKSAAKKVVAKKAAPKKTTVKKKK